MFAGCTSLTNLNIGGWDTSKVKNMSNMFASCNSLTELDLHNWTISSSTNINNFLNSENFEKIHLGANISILNSAGLTSIATTDRK